MFSGITVDHPQSTQPSSDVVRYTEQTHYTAGTTVQWTIMVNIGDVLVTTSLADCTHPDGRLATSDNREKLSIYFLFANYFLSKHCFISKFSKQQSELNHLRRKRGGIKSRLTIFKNYLSTLDSLDNNDQPEINLCELKNRLVRAELLLDEFNHTQADTENFVEQLGLELDERQQFED
nr:unnamed protein product [Callosobruchus chinensis]